MMTDPRGLDRVEEAMRQVAVEGSLGQSLAHHLRAGGKRLRAMLALRAGEDLGIPLPEAVAWATACELLHNATLVHDDLCDRDRQRRGRTAVWAGWGDTVALCLGDLLLAEAFAAVDAIEPAGPRRALRGLLHDCVRRLTHGQAMEADAAAEGVPDREACRRVAEAKTVPLVTLPIAGALTLAGIGEARRDWAVHALGLVGRAYQMLDDIEDLLDDGQDLRRQVPNHALAVYAELAAPGCRSALEKAWRSGALSGEVKDWLCEIRASAALGTALDEADGLLGLAASAIGRAPAAAGPGFSLLAGHLERQAAGLRRRVAEAQRAAARVPA